MHCLGNRCSRVSQSDREALERKPSSCDDEDDLGNGELESDEDILNKTEDDHPELQEVVGCKKNGKRHNSLKSFIYTLYKETKKDKVFICTNQKPRNGGCNARVRQCETSGIFRKDGRPSHNHYPELEKQQQLIIVNAVVEATEGSKENPSHSGNTGFSEAVQRRIQRKKRERLPAIPQSVSMAAELLKANPELGLTLDGKSFYRGHVETVNGEGEALVFLSPSLTPELTNVTELQSDGTFRSLPKKFKQLLTIQLSFENKCYPFAFAMMNKKTRELYDLVMQKVLDVIKEDYPNLTFNIERTMTDFEAGLKDSLREAENQKSRDYFCAVNGGETGRRRTPEHELLDAEITKNANVFTQGDITRREFLELSWKSKTAMALTAEPLLQERVRYTAGFNRPPREPLATLPLAEHVDDAVATEYATYLTEHVDPIEYADVSETTDVSATTVHLNDSNHERSSRLRQLPIRLSSDYVVDARPVCRIPTTVASTSAGSVRRTQTAVASTSAGSVRAPAVARAPTARARGRPSKCRLCITNNKDVRFICCGYQLCDGCATIIQEDNRCCPDCADEVLFTVKIYHDHCNVVEAEKEWRSHVNMPIDYFEIDFSQSTFEFYNMDVEFYWNRV
ncbi:hypothetical protein OUZ56_011275 [Daphnia magna]|uniref:RING-type domain-containing protein n=1 Tax=Daphnia magna TaxID=35525 RepID=A0ABQ9YZP8_9CRUS|nr:hypothetical protein OUZ56_011275 [Daphnia magna]